MKANELRIGNYVEKGIPQRVLSISVNKDSLNGGDFDVYEFVNTEIYPNELLYASEFNPIPLTEEWLLKFGFEKHNESNDYPTCNNNDICYVNPYSYLEGTYYVSLGNDPMFAMMCYGGLKYIYYVHSLQNLYFALTGEELTIKE